MKPEDERAMYRRQGMKSLARAQSALSDAVACFYCASETNLVIRQIRDDLDEEIAALEKD